MVPRFLAALEAAAALRQTAAKLHVVHGSEQYVDPAWFNRQLTIRRAEGERLEPQAEMLAVEQLGTEWEWEDSPEVTLLTLETVEEAIATFNTYSPRLVASFVSADQEAQERFYAAIDAPFVGNGFTRWVDGQFALDRPELGLSNWQQGRLFARSAILSGDSVFTVRTRVTQSNHDLHR